MKKVEKKNHSFNKDIAGKIGIFPAVILTGLSYWVEYFQKTGKNFYDGYYWVYNSITSWQEFYPYATQKQIRTALAKLRDEGYILTANYNKAPFDKTLWYTITDKAIDMLNNENSTNYIPSAGNTPAETHQSVKEEKYKDEIKEIIEYLNNKVGCRFRATSESNNKYIRARLNEGFTIDDFKTVVDNQVANWKNTEWEQYLRPSTLFGNKFENYLNAKIKKSAQTEVSSQNQVSKEEFERLKATGKGF